MRARSRRPAVAILTLILTVAATTQTVDGSSTAPPPAPPSASPPSIFDHWTRVDLPDPAPHEYGGATPRGVVAFRGGFVAAGSVVGDCCDGGNPSLDRGILWTSPDGRNWRLHDPIPAFAKASVHDLVTDGTRLVATGTVGTVAQRMPGDRIAALWTSTDGHRWTRSAGRVPSIVAAGPVGFVGALTEAPRDGGRQHVRFVTSSDGTAWRPVSRRFEAELRGLAVAPDGRAIALGDLGERPDGSWSDDAVMWRSPDGTSWAGPESMAAMGLPGALIATSDGFYGLANRYPDDPDGSNQTVGQLWHIRDGASPRLTELPIGEEGGLGTLLVSGDTVIVTGATTADDNAPLNAAVWVSIDGGRTFGRVREQPGFSGMNNEITGLIEVPGGVIAVGEYWDRSTMHPPPVIWFSGRNISGMPIPGTVGPRVE